VVNIWNSLPEYVVHADTVNCFKSRLDKYWYNQEYIIFVLKFVEPEAKVKLYIKYQCIRNYRHEASRGLSVTAEPLVRFCGNTQTHTVVIMGYFFFGV